MAGAETLKRHDEVGSMRRSVTVCLAAAACAVVLLMFPGCGTTPVQDGAKQPKDTFTLYFDTDGLANNVINDIEVDYFRGGLWVATQKGVSFYSFADSSWKTWGTESGLPNLKVSSIAIDNGTVWVGTRSGPAWFTGTGWSLLPDPGVMPDPVVNTIAAMPEPDYSLWFGTAGGLVRKTLDGTFTTFTMQNGLSYDNVTSIARDASGTMWIGTRNGLSTFDGSKWTVILSALPGTIVLAVYRDSAGAMWIGTSSGIAVYRGTQQTRYGTFDGLPSPSVNDFVEDFDRVLWAATDTGVARFDGKSWKKLTLPSQVDGNQTLSLASDAITSSVWIGTLNGLVRYQPAVH
jgi:ligand-binding sensor domain-containing protein